MLANFTKSEFHEWMLLYILQQLDENDTSMLDETNTEWAEFLEFLQTRQAKSFIQNRRVNLSMKTRTFGKTVVEKIDKQDSMSLIKLMI